MNVTEILLLTVLVVLVVGIGGLGVLLWRRPRRLETSAQALRAVTAEDEAAREAAAAREAELSRREADLEQARAEVDRTRAEVERTRSELGAERDRLAADQNEVNQLRTDLDSEQSRLDTRQQGLDARGTDLESRLDEMRAAQERLRAEIDAERADLRRIRQDQDRRDDRLTGREDRLESEQARLTGLLGELEQRSQDLSAHEADLGLAAERQRMELERISGLTSEQARTELIESARDEADRHSVVITREIETTARREGDARARKIIVDAIQRLASEQTAESVVSTVELPSDDMKGRIIGREGRNIRAFEQITGVNVMIDDTPGTVLISCFDPVRRETARLALIDLINDGRIQPVRIEEAYDRAVRRIEERCLEAAEDACATAGIVPLDPELMPILGSLQYRTSYGQNVLRHLIECAHLAGLMAGELGLDVEQCKRAAFLHDIGKALTHKVPGTHAIVGANLLRKYGEDPDVVHAVEAHHNEVEPHTVEAILTQACDAISGSRPGARRESLETYVERLGRIEDIATEYEGVEKAFAMQAGREVRVMVSPDDVDEIGAQVIARDIAKQIEQELTYPGQIRVTVIRESRATEIAH